MKVSKKKGPQRYFDRVKSDTPTFKNSQNVGKNRARAPKQYSDVLKNTGQEGETKNGEVEVFNVRITPKFLLKQKYKEQKQQRQKQFRKKSENKKFPGKAPIDAKKLETHSRGEGFEGKGVRHPLHKLKLKKRENKIKYAQEQAARSEILLTEDQGFIDIQDEDVNTRAITQKIIADSVDIAAATKIFELNLEFGPYRAKYSRNGRHLLLGSKKGHLAAFDWLTKKLHFEINVMESIHDISWLHVETMVAAAQKEWLYIYDNTGIELHCVKKIDKILRMEFLPYHFLLAAVSEYGFLTWLDISIGEIVGHYNNHLGRTSVMAQNPYNATLCLGNSKGVVSLWSPSVKAPLAKILCHKTPLTAVAVDNRGMYMATSGVDRSLKIWDIRNLDGPVQHYRLRSTPVDLEFSQKDMLAVGLGDIVEVYNNCCTQTVDKAYLKHNMAKTINNFKFCPYEDVLGIGTNRGFTSIIVPGSGEPNFDALESNPFQTKGQRKEAEVKALLEKIPAELITLNPFDVTEIDVPSMKDIMAAKKNLLYLKPKKVDFTPRHKNKGKTNIARKKIIKEAARRVHVEYYAVFNTHNNCCNEVPYRALRKGARRIKAYMFHNYQGNMRQKKEFIDQMKEVKKIVDTPEAQPSTPKPSFGVLNRFVSNPKSKK